jgi:hypothetical protein
MTREKSTSLTRKVEYLRGYAMSLAARYLLSCENAAQEG